MTEDKRNTTTILIFVGIAIGIGLYYLLSKNKQPAIATLNLNSMELGLNTLNQRMNLIEQKLDNLQHNPIQQPIQQPLSPEIMTYKNKMHIIRDANGDIVNIERDAKIIGNNK